MSDGGLDFPSFWEGLSLRLGRGLGLSAGEPSFPFLSKGTFIEAGLWKLARLMLLATFLCPGQGLSLRLVLARGDWYLEGEISLPFRKGFH